MTDIKQEPIEEREEVDKLVLTAEQELVLKGIRPDGMDYGQFRMLRKLINRHIKLYLKGKLKE